MLGIGMAYHRLLTHRSYKTHKWIEYFLTICGTLALEGGPIFWVATHRIHHQKSDQEGDPHTPREGTYWAHMGWILTGEGLHHDASVLARYVPDLARDPFHVWLSNWHWITNVVVGFALLAFGGIPYVLWGIFFRTTFGLHCHLARELGDAPLGLAPLPDPRRLHQQLVGGAPHLRRGLAQQPSRPPDQRPSRPGVVRVRPELDRHQHAAAARLAWDVKVAKIKQPVPHEENDGGSGRRSRRRNGDSRLETVETQTTGTGWKAQRLPPRSRVHAHCLSFAF